LKIYVTLKRVHSLRLLARHVCFPKIVTSNSTSRPRSVVRRFFRLFVLLTSGLDLDIPKFSQSPFSPFPPFGSYILPHGLTTFLAKSLSSSALEATPFSPNGLATLSTISESSIYVLQRSRALAVVERIHQVRHINTNCLPMLCCKLVWMPAAIEV
jgi:hypothetical protein